MHNLPNTYHKNLGFLSKLPALTFLCLENVLPSLSCPDLKDCTALQQLHISMLPMTDSPDKLELDLSMCKQLQELRCSNSQLDTLNVVGCTKLEVVEVVGNQLSELDLSNNTSLKTLACSSNFLEQVLLTGCSALEAADLDDNLELSSLEVAGCSSLVTLSMVEAGVEQLDLSGCMSLTTLDCKYSHLEKLTLSSCSAMEALDFQVSQLVSLDLSGMTGLKKLICPVSTLTSLVLTGCTALSSLYLRNTSELTSLDLLDCHAVTELDLHGSKLQLADLDLTRCPLLQQMPATKKASKGRGRATKAK